jgi:hypothetical protein
VGGIDELIGTAQAPFKAETHALQPYMDTIFGISTQRCDVGL